jgi:C4-dicarboxylate-specific signal transduction histidine kinase
MTSILIVIGLIQLIIALLYVRITAQKIDVQSAAVFKKTFYPSIAICLGLYVVLLGASTLPSATYNKFVGGYAGFAFFVGGIVILALTIGFKSLWNTLDHNLTKKFAESNAIAAEMVLELEQANEKLENTQIKLNQSEKMAALGAMAGGIAHEINNPLAIIYGSARRIKMINERSDEPIDELNTFIEKINEMVKRTKDIVEGMLIFSRNDDKNPSHELTSISEILSHILVFCKERFRQNEIKYEIIGSELPISIFGNANLIGQVFLNLLNNAFDEITAYDDRWIKIEISKTEKNVLISVSNSGPKISSEIVEKIMEPFYTTKEVGKGTGLGLSISTGIIKKHKGTLEVDLSAEYTKFVITLPLAESDQHFQDVNEAS